MVFGKRLSLSQKKQILNAIVAAEKETSGELRVHLSYSKDETNILEAAQLYFETLEMHQTQERNGMLLYLNPKRHQFSVFGDIGIHQKVGQVFWDHLILEVKHAIRQKDLTQGIVHAVHLMGKALKEHFPHREGQINELKDEVTESD